MENNTTVHRPPILIPSRIGKVDKQELCAAMNVESTYTFARILRDLSKEDASIAAIYEKYRYRKWLDRDLVRLIVMELYPSHSIEWFIVMNK